MKGVSCDVTYVVRVCVGYVRAFGKSVNRDGDVGSYTALFTQTRRRDFTRFTRFTLATYEKHGALPSSPHHVNLRFFIIAAAASMQVITPPSMRWKSIMYRSSFILYTWISNLTRMSFTGAPFAGGASPALFDAAPTPKSVRFAGDAFARARTPLAPLRLDSRVGSAASETWASLRGMTPLRATQRSATPLFGSG